MKKVIDISENWLLKYSEFLAGERFNFQAREDTDGWLPTSVPGDVHIDAIQRGLIDDPFFGTNLDHCLWMEEKDWWYRTKFTLNKKDTVNKHVFLDFEGLDCFATVYLNGEVIGKHCNMFTPLKMNITDKFADGINDLRVCLASSLFSPDLKQYDGITNGTPRQRVFSRKAQSSYGWDISPRLVTCGIWKPVRIIITDDIEFADIWVQTLRLDESSAMLELEFTVNKYVEGKKDVSVSINMLDQSRTVKLKLKDGETLHKEKFIIEDPPVWWPHNHGRPELVSYELVLSENGVEVERYSDRFGIRTVEMVREEAAEGRESFYFRINGKQIFMKGMNWTPCDAIYARITDERYRKLVDKAVETNINALRVWGGGMYESDAFYRRCDEKGVLVWQDFMFACGIYPQNKEFLSEVKAEAEYIVKRLRKHPSIFIWCGDNEIDWGCLQENVEDFWNNKISRKVLKKACGKYDPHRPYIVSTPFSRNHEHPNDPNSGNVHLWKHGSSFREEFYSGSHPNFVTEMGHISLPDMEVIKASISEKARWPVHNAEWYMHCSDPRRCGESHRVGTWFSSIRKNNMKEPENLQELIEAMQKLQTDATEYWIRHFSSQPQCWGLFLWNLCDNWPQVSDAYIAYPFNEKPALKKVKEGYAGIKR